jgi:AcrR family transcriptional regulator
MMQSDGAERAAVALHLDAGRGLANTLDWPASLMTAPAYKPANLENKSVQRILRAALERWTRDGYHGASLKDVADTAGVAKSLVHYHFVSKEHLLIELQADWCRRVARTMRERMAAGPPSLEAALSAFDQVWDALVATRNQFGFGIEVWRQSLTQPAIRARLVEFDREIAGLCAEGLRVTLGPLATELAVPLDRAAALVQVVLDGLSFRLFLDDDVASVRRTFDDVRTILVAALLPGAPRTSGGTAC